MIVQTLRKAFRDNQTRTSQPTFVRVGYALARPASPGRSLVEQGSATAPAKLREMSRPAGRGIGGRWLARLGRRGALNCPQARERAHFTPRVEPRPPGRPRNQPGPPHSPPTQPARQPHNRSDTYVRGRAPTSSKRQTASGRRETVENHLHTPPPLLRTPSLRRALSDSLSPAVRPPGRAADWLAEGAGPASVGWISAQGFAFHWKNSANDNLRRSQICKIDQKRIFWSCLVTVDK